MADEFPDGSIHLFQLCGPGGRTIRARVESEPKKEGPLPSAKEAISIKSCQFLESMSEKLNAVRDRDELVDFHLVVNEVKVGAHKAVLSIASPYFEAMFSGNFVETNQKNLDVSGIVSTLEDLNSILTYMYTRKLTITNNNLCAILKASSHFLLDDLSAECTEYMRDNLNLHNALTWWAESELYQLNTVAPLCELIVLTRFHDYFIHQDVTLSVAKDFLLFMINKGIFDCMNQSAIDMFLIKWVQLDPIERGPQISEITRSSGLKTNVSCSDIASKILISMDSKKPVGKKDMLLIFSPASNTSVRVYCYYADSLQWLDLGVANTGHPQTRFYGMFRDNLWCKGNESKAIFIAQLNTNKCTKVNAPCHLSSNEGSTNYFCFDDNLFCIRDEVYDHPEHGGTGRSFHRLALYILVDQRKWIKLFYLPFIVEESEEYYEWGAFEHFSVVDPTIYVTEDVAYIMVTYNQSSDIDLVTKLFGIKRQNGTYAIIWTIDVPCLLEEGPEIYYDYTENDRMQRDINSNLVVLKLVYTEEFDIDEGIYHRDRRLVYSPATDKLVQEPLEEANPIALTNILKFEDTRTNYTLRVNPKNIHGLYSYRMPYSYCNQVWHHEPDSNTWKRLPSPPTCYKVRFDVFLVNMDYFPNAKPVTKFQESAGDIVDVKYA